MKKFKFSLESVLTIAQKTLKDEQIALASIVNVFNKQNDVLDEMNFALRSYGSESEGYLENSGFDPMVIANYAAFAQKLSQDIKMQKQMIEKTRLDIERQQKVVKQAYIKVKSLENLKDRQKENYVKELLMEEVKEIDDIVNSKRTA